MGECKLHVSTFAPTRVALPTGGIMIIDLTAGSDSDARGGAGRLRFMRWNHPC